ncbi:MAG TPA: outer membrane protein assembly factor BamA, partial [Pseudoxanthomonas sp.]
TVAINLQVVPGPRVNVRRIVFKGNTRTSDEVMRREMRQFEGSWFSQVAVDRSRVRLRRLGFFETVDAETSPVPGTDDQVDVVFTVKETTSGSFMFGLGYSQTDGLTTSFELSQNNFTGSGNRIAVSAKRNSYQNAYSFSYTNPYFTDEGLALGYQATWSEIDYSDYNAAQYNTTNTAFQSVFGLPISENDSVSMSLGIDSKQVTVYESYTPQAIIDYIDAVGQRTFHAWRSELGWARDTRNDYFMPTSGMYQRVSADIALPGSTVEYFKINYDLSKYWPLAPWLVMLTRAELGYGDSYGADIKRYICRANGSDPQVSGQTTSDGSSGPGGVCGADATLERTLVASGLPFFENFYAGGTRSIRGFEDNSLGPRSEVSSSYPDGQPLGGSFKTIGSVELLFPKLFDSNAARVSAFLDIGNVFDGYKSFDSKELRASTGIALLWRAPVGPISISYSFPVRKEEGDKLERLQFSFGGGF